MDKRQKKQSAAMQRRLRKIRASRKAAQFITLTLIQILFVGLLCAFAFVYCSRLAAAYLLANEGMSARAAFVMGNEDFHELTLYFSEPCLAKDDLLNSDAYSRYTITDYGYGLQITRTQIAPWNAHPFIEVIEQVKNIKGSSNIDDDNTPPPAWIPMRYRLSLGYVRGRWMIIALAIEEKNPELPPVATPNPEMNPIPMVTATPKATGTPAPTKSSTPTATPNPADFFEPQGNG